MAIPNATLAPRSWTERHDPIAGARNLLIATAGVRPGDSVLIVVEPPQATHYRGDIGALVAAEAAALGAEVRVVVAPPAGGPETFPAALAAQIGEVDHTIFFSRLGDQVRFAELPGHGSKTMTYTLDPEFLGDAFGRLPFGVLEEIRDRLVARIAPARRYSIRCPRGSDLTVEIAPKPAGAPALVTPFTVINFPTMIFPPVSAEGANGRLVLSHVLSSTSIHAYDDDILPLPTPVTLHIEAARVVALDGDPDLVARVVRQFERVAALVGGEAWALNSWHTGINPTTFFPHPSLEQIERWGCVAFGSPRYTHFHLCGHPPGDICAQVFDATIAFDDEVLWQDGRFVFLERPENLALLEAHGIDLDIVHARRDLGI